MIMRGPHGGCSKIKSPAFAPRCGRHRTARSPWTSRAWTSDGLVGPLTHRPCTPGTWPSIASAGRMPSSPSAPTPSRWSFNCARSRGLTIPLLILSEDEQLWEQQPRPERVVGLWLRYDMKATVELALRLLPRTRRLALVNGSSPWERAQQEQMMRELQPLMAGPRADEQGDRPAAGHHREDHQGAPRPRHREAGRGLRGGVGAVRGPVGTGLNPAGIGSRSTGRPAVTRRGDTRLPVESIRARGTAAARRSSATSTRGRPAPRCSPCS
ncbi:hypothetical protein WA016_07749 [Myxococcus stipitatus]